MNQRSIQLLEDEEVVFEGGPTVLTNQRLLASWIDSRGREASVEAFLRDLVSFRKVNGGQQSRLKPGLNAMGAGAAILVVGMIARGAPELLEVIFFLVGALAFLLGTYFTLSTILGVKPYTVVLFQTQNLEDVAVPFPGWDNPEAEALTRAFVRTKRGL